MNLKKKLHSFFFPDIWRSLSVSLRYAAGIGAMQKVKPLPRTVSRYPVVDHSLCSGCKLCVKVCPAAALQVRTVFQESEKAAVTFSHLPDRCVSCGLCVEACPENALVLKGK